MCVISVGQIIKSPLLLSIPPSKVRGHETGQALRAKLGSILTRDINSSPPPPTSLPPLPSKVRGHEKGHTIESQDIYISPSPPLPSEVRGHETGQAIESQAGVVLAVTRDILPHHVSSEHDNIETFVEGLGSAKVTNTLENK